MALYKIEKDASGVPTGETSLVAGGTNFADNPIGTILPYGGSTVPSGWFLCDGSEVSKTTYSELYAVIGDAFGTASVSTNFCLPDMRESVPKGAGLTGHTVGAHLDADGLAVGEFLDDRFQGHNHNSSQGAYTQGAGSYLAGAINGASITNNLPQYVTTDGTNGTPRVGATTEVKSVGVNYIIKAKMVAVPIDFLAKVGEAVVEKNEYSTTETVVGKWIDGKPIYRKVYEFGSLPNNGTTSVAIGDDTIRFISLQGIAVSGRVAIPIPGDGSTGTNTVFTSTTNVTIKTNTDMSAYKGYVIAEYTKTTD